MISSLRADAFVESSTARGRLAVRKAVMHDIPPILDLINGYAAKGIMLPRTEFELSEAIRDFTVVTLSGDNFRPLLAPVEQGSCGAGGAPSGPPPCQGLLGCGALHFYSPTIGEIRSLAVHEQAKTHGVGRRLVEALVAEAQEYELDTVFAFTYVAEFFQKVGFHEVERGALPLKAWKDCVRCPKFQACDEIAVLRILRPEHGTETQPLWGQALASADDQLIQIPTPLKL
ncbi:MAG: GNAT family N-acetyltransferase [Bryobacteraceae bacterium]|jgi:amino-acid N-acetyltransferase